MQGRPLEGPVWLSFTARAQHEQERGWKLHRGDLELAKDPCRGLRVLCFKGSSCIFSVFW